MNEKVNMVVDFVEEHAHEHPRRVREALFGIRGLVYTISGPDGRGGRRLNDTEKAQAERWWRIVSERATNMSKKLYWRL